MNSSSISALVYAALSLAVSGLILLALFFIFYGVSDTGRAENISLPGNQFTAAIGQAEVLGDSLVVSGFKTDRDRKHALITNRSGFDSSDYRFLSLDFRELGSGVEVSLFWIPADREGFFRLPVAMHTEGDVVLDMGVQPNWGGTIKEIGLVFKAGNAPTPVTFGGLLLEPSGTLATIRYLLNEWTRLRGFSYSSSNTLPATFSGTVLSPVLVAGAWMVLSLLLLALAGRVRKAIPGVSFLVVLLVPWVLLDLLWQRELSAELTRTNALFANKSMVERHAVDVDRVQYQYAMELKAEVLPPTPVRLFILHDSYGHNFDRLKMQYYLLPHNIYNYGSLPPEESLREGDYILALGSIPGLEYDEHQSSLIWDGDGRLPVALKHVHPQGKLFVSGGGPSSSQSGSEKAVLK